MFTHDLVDTSIPGEVVNRSPRTARVSSEGIKLDGLLYHSSVQLVKEIMNRSPAKRDRTLDRSRAEERQNRSRREESTTPDNTNDRDALERARRRIAAWPKRYRTAQSLVDETDIGRTHHSRTRDTHDPTSYIIVDETTQRLASASEDDDLVEQPRRTSRNGVRSSPPTLEQPSIMPANDLSSSSSSAFRRRFEQIQSESPARVAWTKERSAEGASSLGGIHGRDVITDGGGDARGGRLSGTDLQDDARRSRMDTGPQESSNPHERTEKSRNISPRPNGTTTADESPRSRVTFSLPSDAEKHSNLTSRRQDTASSRRHQESYSPPSPRDPPRTKGSFTELARGKSGIDMSFSHVQHSTPIRSSDMHGHAVAGGVKGFLGPSSEEEDTLDSTVSSSPPAQPTSTKVLSEAGGNDSYIRGKTSLARRTSWPNADEAVAKYAGQSKRRRDSVKSQEDTSAVPPPGTYASTYQQENNTSRGSFKQSPLARWMEGSALQEKEEITTPLSHLMKRTISQEKEQTLTPFPLRKSESIFEGREQSSTPFSRRMERPVSQETRTPSPHWMERSVSQEKEETWTPLSHQMKRSVSREKAETTVPTTVPSSRRMERSVSQEKVKTRIPSPGRMERSASQEKEQPATPFSRRMSGSVSQDKEQTGTSFSRRMRRSVSQEKVETRTPSPRRLERSDLPEKEETRTPSSLRMNRSVSQEKEQTGAARRTRTEPSSDSGEKSRADFVAAKVWNTLRSRESSRRESAARAGTPTSVPPGQVFSTPTSQDIHQMESRPGQDEQLQGDTAREAFQLSGDNNSTHHNSTHHNSEQVSITFDNVQQSSTIPTPESPKVTTPIPYAAVTASPQAQRLARAVTQQVMTWIEQEALRTQEQEAASRAREEAEEVLRKRLRLREDKTAQESRSAWWGWWWTLILGYVSLLGLFAMMIPSSTSHTAFSPSDEFYYANYYSAAMSQQQPWGFMPQLQQERVCRWVSGLTFSDLDEQDVVARCGGSGKSRSPRRKQFRVPV